MSEGSQKILSWKTARVAALCPGFLLAPALFPEGKRQPTSWGNHVSQVVQGPSAGPGSGNFHYEDPVAVVESAAQDFLELRSRHGGAHSPDGMHQWDGLQIPQLLVEVGIAAMPKPLADQNVQLLLHRRYCKP